ncbi:MAG: ExbD/TolR family protein [Bacteroidota bacterium]|jgi:biopolymer transport protein ExbD|nr:biopolymer transporter ExbD [Sphingobacteriales bacterium]
MPKVKVPRKSTTVDMTAMTDVAFLLLTFFMLATKFKPDEPVIVDTPSSISEIKLPESNVILITIDKNDRVFFGVDGQPTRETVLRSMAEKYKVSFTEKQIKEFSLMSTFGVPIAQLPQLLDMKAEERLKVTQSGIPCDSLNNELSDWIWQTRLANNVVRIAVKGDRETNYPVVKKVIATLQERKVNRFNFITSMERPE